MTTQPILPAGPRPKRFPLELPLEVRVAGSSDWWNATTEDISANGMRFRAGNYVAPQTPVDVKLQLPPALTGDGTVRLECSGYVVRSNKPSLVSDEARMAVTFLEFHFADGPQGGAPRTREAKTEAIRRELAAHIHRLNSLLFIIMGSAELISGDARLESSMREFGSHAMEAAEEAAEIVRSIAASVKEAL